MKQKDPVDELLDVLSVLKEIDLAISPIVPTERMCKAGADIGGISLELAKRVYVTMLLNAQDLQRDPRYNIH